jgi:hypothetical protein
VSKDDVYRVISCVRLYHILFIIWISARPVLNYSHNIVNDIDMS